MRTLLIDADIVAYQSAAVHEEHHDFGVGVGVGDYVDEEAAKRTSKEIVEGFLDALKGDDVIICMSHNTNWRKELWLEYKANRANTVRPEALMEARKALRNSYPWVAYKRLEGDDVMGILATEPHKGERIMVSEDKDMMSIPGLLYRPHHHKMGVLEISPIEADRFHMWQTIVGDKTDGIPGCHGLGEGCDYATDIIQGFDDEDMWESVTAAYDLKGQTEEDAILMARLTRILRHGEFDKKTGKVKLWNPWFLRLSN